MNSIVFHCGVNVDIWVVSNDNTTTHTIQHNATQHNTTTLVIFTYQIMAEVLGAVASAVTVVEAAGKVWSTGWKYYQVRIPPNKFEPQSVVNNFIWG